MNRLKALCFSLSLLGACSSDDNPQSSTIDAATARDARSGDAGNQADCEVRSGTALALEPVASGLSSPVFLTAAPGDPRLFILEQDGRIRIVKDGVLLDTPFLDLRSIIRDDGDEQGLLGLAFHPNYSENGRFFVNYTAEEPDSATVVAAYTVSADNPDVASSTGQRLLTIAQENVNHNGGMLAFGPDGYLYVALGDGGDADDDHGPGRPEHGQDTSTLLGSLLRIDVNNGATYSVPADNPFVGGEGADEIWSVGLRNPWRFSFDRQTGDLYVADVGQGCWEEVNVQPAASTGGENYGWNVMEGAHCFGPELDETGCPELSDCDMTGLVLPVHEYPHMGGRCSITGGYVYRGGCLPDIQGWYFFGDYCTGDIYKFEYSDGSATNLENLTEDLLPSGARNQLTSFGEDASGELYVLYRDGTVHRIVAEE